MHLIHTNKRKKQQHFTYDANIKEFTCLMIPDIEPLMEVPSGSNSTVEEKYAHTVIKRSKRE